MEKTIVIPIKIGQTERKYTVQYPKVGQFIRIQVRQSQLATSFDGKNQYFNLVRQNTKNSFNALSLIDMIAHFEVLIPELITEQNLENLNSIEDLDMMDAKPLLDAYNNVLYPWLKKWEDVFGKAVDDNKKEDKNEQS
jgi:hypothetical protein